MGKVTDEMIEAGMHAWGDAPLTTVCNEMLVSVYLAMRASRPRKGKATLPEEATPAMYQAGHGVVEKARRDGLNSAETMCAIWRAMLAAWREEAGR